MVTAHVRNFLITARNDLILSPLDASSIAPEPQTFHLLTPPLNVRGEHGGKVQPGAKIHVSGRAECFGEDVSQIVLGWNVLEGCSSAEDLFSDEMIF